MCVDTDLADQGPDLTSVGTDEPDRDVATQDPGWQRPRADWMTVDRHGDDPIVEHDPQAGRLEDVEPRDRREAARAPLRLAEVHAELAVANEHVDAADLDLQRRASTTQRLPPHSDLLVKPVVVDRDLRARPISARGIGGQHDVAAARAG
jgi:hypothetical protein